MKERHPFYESKNIDFIDDLENLVSKCSVCEKKFKIKSDLIRHLKTHSEGVKEMKHKCETCNKEFLRKDNQERHSRKCSRFRCVVCHVRFLRIKDVNHHFEAY